MNTSILPISGFPEHLPSIRLVEEDLIDEIRKQYRLCAFTPLETAAVERMETLLAKGDMGRQIYKIGRASEDTDTQQLGLHFDLTVPLARYVVQHSHELVFPFRRYQIQKVWRGERAQEGRYKEFYQCDIDIVGNGQLDTIHDAEIVAVIARVFSAIDLKEFKLHVSNLKIVAEFAHHFGLDQQQTRSLREIMDRSKKEGLDRSFSEVGTLFKNHNFMSAFRELILATSIDQIATLFHSLNIQSQGVQDLKEVIAASSALGFDLKHLVIDVTICRGLDYYTGTVFETFLPNESLSICSGGRYDDLASHFSDRRYPGVGISIGLSRLLAILLKNKKMEALTSTPAVCLITMQDRDHHFGDYCQIAGHLRSSGIPTEIFLEKKSLRDQLGYAAAIGVPFVVIAGESEFARDEVQVKSMRSKSVEQVHRLHLAEYLMQRYKSSTFHHTHVLT